MYPIKVDKKYNPSDLENLGNIYTVPYLGNYEEGVYKEFVGSHPGVDIVPENPNSDIFACLDGEIYKTGDDLSYGKYIFIKHENVPNPDNFDLKTTLFSCYEHLYEIQVEVGDKVFEGDIIGKTGNSGISFGEHLHFQIDRDTAPYHAYWPYTGEDVKNAGCDFSQGVNLKLGYENALKYTINPLVYLDEISKIKKNILKATSDVATNNNDYTPIIKNDIVINDLKSDNKYYNFIVELVQKNIFNLDNGFFKGTNLITRGEFLKIIFLYNNIEISKNNEEYFLDVKSNYWQNKYINTAVEKNIISTNNKYFNPNENISRIEALKIYSKLAGINIGENQIIQINNIEGSDWKYKYASYFVENSIFQLDENKCFSDNYLTRFDALKLLKIKK